jgi:hypothetical protein
MKRLACIFCIVFYTAAFSAPAYLVTPEEMRASNDAPLQISPRSSPVKDAPSIEVIAPKLPGSVSSPTPIDLKFQAIAPSNVKPDSFKALYGTFQIDITKRLLSLAKVTETGVQVQDATLPKGRHKILLLIEDSSGRPGSRMLEFDVQ